MSHPSHEAAETVWVARRRVEAAQHSAPGRTRERGAALVIALMAMLLFTALGVSLVLTTSTETMIAGNFRDGYEALYAADAGVERVIDDLLTAPDWNNILNGTTQSPFVIGSPTGSRTLADGTSINLAEATNMLNCGKVVTCSVNDMNDSTGNRPWGANNPRWTLYACGLLSEMASSLVINSNVLVVVWVGDDQSENDGDPTKDGSTKTNPGSGVLAMHVEAYGSRGTRRVLEVTLAKTRILSWRELP
jgi:Tfp pilus assembly protein PilX